jgi:dTDP-4-amino-4,6-dideoxygalactose transaminase
MTNLQAAVGVAQLSKLDDFILKKRQIAESYARN